MQKQSNEMNRIGPQIMPAFYAYTFAIRGTQSTDGSNNPVDYTSPPSGTWTYAGGQTGFLIEEANKNNSSFEGDKPDGRVPNSSQIGKGNAQTTEINGAAQQVIWDYTFQVQDPVTNQTYDIGVVDVDLNNDGDVTDSGEAGYYLIFINDVPPPGTVFNVTGATFDATKIEHTDLGGELVCFVAGTLIETKDGPKPIEDLALGDMVLTRDAGYQPLRWLGKTAAAAQGDLAPIVISKGTLGNTADLVVSPQHAVLVEDWRAELLYGEADVLIRAKDLIGHDGIYRKPGGIVTYCHMLFDAHQLVQAAGIWSESLYPGEMTREMVCPEARHEIETLFPDLKGYGPKSARCLRRFEAVCLAA